MTTSLRHALALTVLVGFAAPVAAQSPAPDPPAADDSVITTGRPITMQHFRPADQRGLHIFEAPKEPGLEYTGFKVDFGAAFASQFQGLRHENAAAPNVVNGVNANQLIEIGNGFNNSTANLYLHAQLADGIRVQLSSYLSSRHHPETWVKDGFLLVDKSPIDLKPLHTLMKYATLKAGHFEINYGDAHFRRSDNGNAMYNPFVGNYILDAFTTEVGAELYLRSEGIIAMGSVTGGEIRGTVLNPRQRSASYIGKLGFDRQLNPDLRVRLTGSAYRTKSSASNTLYGGDRAGSRYYYVLENTTATEAAQASSGMINPGLRNSVTAVQVNPFVRLRGFEVFGVIERAEGKAAAEGANRVWNQQAVDVVYRFGPSEQFYTGTRYNRAEGQLAGIANDVGAKRWHLAGGWFVTPMILAKLEYVNHEFFGYPENNIRHGGKFNGMMLEGVVAF